VPPILNAQELTKSFGAEPLFRAISFTVEEGDRVGLIGPNGSGKSTLLQILAGTMEPDGGEVARRKLVAISYVPQESVFAAGPSVREVVDAAMERAKVPETERVARLSETLGRTGFTDFEEEAASLSGGWRKRLAIAEALVSQPDLLLLDEPTNHLDLAGIEWLEGVLTSARFAVVVVSHDRYFLENVATSITELNRAYPGGMLRVVGNYSQFLEKKEEFLEAQAKRQEALENRVRNEIEWLRRGPKARTTKSKARIDRAHELMNELAEVSARNRTATAQVDFTETGRQTKRLLELQDVSCELGGRILFRDLNFIFKNGTRVGLVGPNGSGKSTLLHMLRGDLPAAQGEIKRAEHLKVVFFEQDRTLDPTLTLRRALAPDSDSVIYQDRVIHVAGWAARFLFTGEQLDQPVSRLSGGERARVLIAQLMLQPADLLLLDEPTNDLDIPTLEVLEETLLEYRGALALVTHDRYMLDRISNVVLGLNGRGEASAFADYAQWEQWQEDTTAPKPERRTSDISRTEHALAKRKLSYMEAREYAALDEQIPEAERLLQEKRVRFEDPAIASDAAKLIQAQAEMDDAQRALDKLVERWLELEEKRG